MADKKGAFSIQLKEQSKMMKLLLFHVKVTVKNIYLHLTLGIQMMKIRPVFQQVKLDHLQLKYLLKKV